ncbi:hypothetical protein KIPB_013110, partial [Kipferlia bialata]|eukprot:g13110.t1
MGPDAMLDAFFERYGKACGVVMGESAIDALCDRALLVMSETECDSVTGITAISFSNMDNLTRIHADLRMAALVRNGHKLVSVRSADVTLSLTAGKGLEASYEARFLTALSTLPLTSLTLSLCVGKVWQLPEEEDAAQLWSITGPVLSALLPSLTSLDVKGPISSAPGAAYKALSCVSAQHSLTHCGIHDFAQLVVLAHMT